MEFGTRPDPKRRMMGIGFVVVLHLFILYALVTGLARKAIEVLPAPIQTKIVDEILPQETEPPPPPPPPTIEIPPAAFIPPPEIVVRQPPPQNNAITAVTSDPTPTPPPTFTQPKRVAPVINARRNCPEPEYPALSLRLGEKGTVMLAFLIDTEGRVKESKIQETSGFPRLDEAARRALSRCRFIPGTVDGRAEESWANLRYTWKIPN